ncbi:MAG: hypothetical protein HYS27_15835 [Deltaproteobacteria bacterium]|nr:hypothetical protein [Deltaproteobacteria bacterium]
MAFRGLRSLGKLADAIFPPGLFRDLAHAVLLAGVENLSRTGGPAVQEAIQGVASAAAIRRGLVPANVLEKATSPGQKAALLQAAESGDLATMKSILRHNKKKPVEAPPTKPAAPITTSAPAERSALQSHVDALEAMVRDLEKGVRKSPPIPSDDISLAIADAMRPVYEDLRSAMGPTKQSSVRTTREQLEAGGNEEALRLKESLSDLHGKVLNGLEDAARGRRAQYLDQDLAALMQLLEKLRALKG